MSSNPPVSLQALIAQFIEAAEEYRLHSELLWEYPIEMTTRMIKARDKLQAVLAHHEQEPQEEVMSTEPESHMESSSSDEHHGRHSAEAGVTHPATNTSKQFETRSPDGDGHDKPSNLALEKASACVQEANRNDADAGQRTNGAGSEPAGSLSPPQEQTEMMNLRIFRDDIARRFFVYNDEGTGNGATPEEAMREWVRCRNSSAKDSWPVKVAAAEAREQIAPQEQTEWQRLLSWSAQLVRLVCFGDLSRNVEEEVCEPVRKIALAMRDEAQRLKGAVAEVREHPAPQEHTELWLRQEWWAGHGCPMSALYGDDGEMQCNAAARHRPLDFKRDSLESLHAHVHQLRLLAAAEAREGHPEREPDAKDVQELIRLLGDASRFLRSTEWSDATSETNASDLAERLDASADWLHTVLLYSQQDTAVEAREGWQPLALELLQRLKEVISLYDDPCPYDAATTRSVARQAIVKG